MPALIEAADQGLSSRTEVQNARCGIVDMLRGAMDDAVVAEEICTMLNGVMAKSLLTLKMVSTMLRMVATTDLTRDVARLRRHDFERVCALAPSIVRGGRRPLDLMLPLHLLRRQPGHLVLMVVIDQFRSSI